MKIKNKKNIFSFLLVLISGVGIFFLVTPTHAATTDPGWAATIVANLISVIISGLGMILSLVISALIAVAQYSNFINAPAVNNGWKIVRDVCNMFFVLILLIIAFATILKIEKYNYKQWLPKLILMAILINFSKTICGLLIDFSQVIMLTFVNAFKDVGGGNIVDTLGLKDIMTLATNDNTTGTVTFLQVTGGYLIGLIYLLIALVVIITMLAMLVIRMVMIWIYVVLSPAAYLFSAFPDGKAYASQWWSEFTKNLIVGPVLAFFIWLSFASLQATNITVANGSTIAGADSGVSGTTVSPGDKAFSATNASTPNFFIKFVVAIGMLIGGLTITQQIGGVAGGMAGKGMSKISKGAAFATGAVGGFALGRAKAVGRGARNTALGVGAGAIKLTGKGISKLGTKYGTAGGRTDKSGQFIQSMGTIGLNWRSDMIAKNKKQKIEKRQKFLEKVGMGEKTMEATSTFLKKNSGKNFTNIAGATSTGAALGSTLGLGGAVIGGGIGAAVGGLQAGAGWLGKKMNKWGDNQKVGGNNAWGDTLKFVGNGFKSAQTFATETTQKAAAKGGKEITDAKQRVGVLANDPAAMKGPSGFSPATFYSKSGQSSAQKKNFEQLVSNDNPDSASAISNLENWANSTFDPTDDKEEDRMNSLVQGIAAFKKGDGDTSRLSSLIAAVNSRSTIGDVASQDSKVIANRKTGRVGEQGSGEFAVNTFASNGANIEGKNVIGVDFNKLKGAGVDVNAEANFSSGEAMAPLIKAVSDQIDSAKENLVVEHSSGNISTPEYISKNNELTEAKERLNDPNLSNLNLVNTASSNYGRQEKMASVYHEEIHAGGVQDEDLTENISKNLMENKLYGRNAATGGRHATEIAQKAKVMKDEGRSNEEIMTEVDKEVKSRVNTEGKNRAERVVKLQSGEKETESQAVEEETEVKEKKKIEEPTVNTEELQNNIDLLSKKFDAAASAFNVRMGNSKSNTSNYQSLTYPLKQLNLNMIKNTSLLRKMTNGKAPTTVIEASAINDEVDNETSE